MGGQERHTHTKGTVRRESFMDEHYNTIKPDTARCYMCRRYGNRYIKQPKSIWLINIFSNGWRSSSSICWTWPSWTVESNGAKQYRQCRKVWVASSYKRKASLAATKADITLHQEQNIPNLATMNDEQDISMWTPTWKCVSLFWGMPPETLTVNSTIAEVKWILSWWFLKQTQVKQYIVPSFVEYDLCCHVCQIWHFFYCMSFNKSMI